MSFKTLKQIFRDSVNKPAITNVANHGSNVPSLTLSYPQLELQINQLGDQLLALTDLKPGDSISLLSHNSIEFLVSFLSTTFLRCISCPLNPKFTQSELEFYLEDSKSKWVIVHKQLLEEPDAPILKVVNKFPKVKILALSLKDGNVVLNTLQSSDVNVKWGVAKNIAPQENDIALLLHTSGTTGRPKAVPLTHINLVTTMYNIKNTYQLTNYDTSLVVMPLFHVHGLIGALLSTLISGGHAVVPPRFSANSFWNQFQSFKCTWYSAVPTIHQILLSSPSPKKEQLNIRFIRSCSSSLAPQTFHDLEERFGAPVLEAYAMTEAAHQMTSNPLPPQKRKPGSVGKPQGVEVVILNEAGKPVEEGEVCIRGINVTKGYLNNPKANSESFTQEGYFRTGDQGKLDSEGYLFLTGRIKELINRGGEKISPLEIDATLLRHPVVAEAVSFAVPDKKYGQEVHAAIRLKSDAKLNETELKEFCKKHIADFKIPKKIYFTKELPKTPTGKIQRRKMVDYFFNKAKL